MLIVSCSVRALINVSVDYSSEALGALTLFMIDSSFALISPVRMALRYFRMYSVAFSYSSDSSECSIYTSLVVESELLQQRCDLGQS